MRQDELIGYVSAVSGQHQKIVQSVIQALVHAIADALIQDDVALFPGLGKMVIVERAARKGRNPKTGEPIEIPPKRVVVFRPSKALEGLINGKR